ncbi:DUF1844 domain-containing protein [bacterium]|nr:DUF1844 domain-containing protein [bacterium]
MTDPSDPEKKIHVDSDWKEQVRQEKENLASEEAPQAPPAESSESTNPSPEGAPVEFPPADFSFLISMLATQAFAAMGQIPDPSTGQATKHPEVAKHMIDLLAVLQEKTKGNLSTDEDAVLENMLHQLRMVYVETTR